MDVKMDEFLVLTRASHIFGTLKEKGLDYLNHLGEEKSLSQSRFLVPISMDGESTFPKAERVAVVTNMKFILESLVKGMEIKNYVLCRTDKTIENVLIATFPFTRKDNGENIDVKIALIPTESDILAITPFNSPDIVERFKSPNQYCMSIMATDFLKTLSYVDNKEELVNRLYDKHHTGGTLGEHILNIFDAMATSIHMQCEYFLKAYSNVQEYGYKVITKDSKEFEAAYGKYGEDLNPDLEDVVPIEDFMPLIVTDGDISRTLAVKDKDAKYGIESSIVAYEDYETLLAPEAHAIKEVLIRCPEISSPVAIKLPPYSVYSDFNTLTVDGRDMLLLEPGTPLIADSYNPTEIDGYGTENFITDRISSFTASLKMFGIRAGSKMYEYLMPVVKLPIGIAKNALRTIRSVFQASNKIEKEESEEVQEKMLNDELDTLTEKFDTMFRQSVLLVAATFFLTSIFTGLVIWLISRTRIKGMKIKAFERTERRIVSRIGEYETKIGFANQESNYKEVKELTRRRDNYKMMLDKLREVKKDALGKEEKYTDTYKEYQD